MRTGGFGAAAVVLVLVSVPTFAQGRVSAAVAAQEGSSTRAPGRGQGGGGISVQEVERRFDQLELVEARRALGMDEQAFEPVAERLRRVQALRRRHQVQRRTLLRELRTALEADASGSNEAAMTATLTTLGGLGVRQAQEMRRAQQALDTVLSVRQRAEFRLFQERFERQKLDLLARARQGRGGGVPPVIR